MKTSIFTSRHFYMPTIILALVMAAIGCEQTPRPGETYRKVSIAWPIYDLELTKGVTSDGITWEKEKGDACFFLASWEKKKQYDQNEFLIYSKERNTFIPFYSDEVEETRELREHKLSVLFLFPYYTRQVKTPEVKK